jgi:hypothetical protein
MAEQVNTQADPAAETKTDDSKRRKVTFKVNVKAGLDKRYKKGECKILDAVTADAYVKAGIAE